MAWFLVQVQPTTPKASFAYREIMVDQATFLPHPLRDNRWLSGVLGILVALVAGWLIGTWGLMGALLTVGVPVALIMLAAGIPLEPKAEEFEDVIRQIG